MWKKKTLTLLTAGLMAASAIQPVVAAPGGNDYNDGYAKGYQEGYTAGLSAQRASGPDNAQYDQLPPPPPDYGPPGPPPPPPGGTPVEAYGHDYRAAEQDAYYRDCQQQRAGNTAGGLIIGALAGGILGNAISRGPQRGAGTALGAILGGAAGASIGSSLSCEDRGYAYRTYYTGFEAGRPHARYDWRSPRSEAYGYLVVGDYYRDRDGFRCATYTQTIYVRGRPEIARGRACRQRDGYWAFVS